LWKTGWRFLRKLETELLHNPETLLLGIYPKECKIGYSRDICTPMFIAALFTRTKLWKQPRSPIIDKWVMKLLYIYTQWSITQPQGIMTWGLKVNRCTWRTSYSVKLARIRNTKDTCFLSFGTDRSKDKHIQKKSYTNSVIEHVCNSVTTLWNSGKERKEKRMIEQQ
jgi:hypothetical protein